VTNHSYIKKENQVWIPQELGPAVQNYLNKIVKQSKGVCGIHS